MQRTGATQDELKSLYEQLTITTQILQDAAKQLKHMLDDSRPVAPTDQLRILPAGMAIALASVLSGGSLRVVMDYLEMADALKDDDTEEPVLLQRFQALLHSVREFKLSQN